jgi:acetoin utilization protein AcuB
MLVEDVMHEPVVTVEASTTVTEAYRTMHDRTIRHLPVVEDGALAGVVTDRDLRYATSRLHPSPVEGETPVRQIMTKDVITAGPRDPVEEAARILRMRRIGCLPVLDGDDLVGIVTVTNLLDAIIRLTGLAKPGGRLAVSLVDEPGELARLTHRVADEGLDVRSVLSYYEDEIGNGLAALRPPEETAATDAPDDEAEDDDTPPSRLRVILRINTLNVRPLARDLREEGFDVVWPVDKPS